MANNDTKKTGANVHPVDDWLLVRRSEDGKSEAGLELPQSDDPDRVLRGAIVAQGPGMPTMSGERMGMKVLATGGAGLTDVHVGDGVMYLAQNAQEIRIVSGKYDLVRFRDLIAVLKTD